jgi:hypothetical protein
MTRSSFLLAATLCAALVGAAYAQGLGGRLAAWRGDAIALSGLSAQQSSAFTDLQARQRAFRRAAHAEFGQLLDSAQTELAQPDADLRALSQDTTRTLSALALEAAALRQERLAFYESLNPAQQAEARAMLQRRLARLQHVHALIGDVLADLH